MKIERLTIRGPDNCIPAVIIFPSNPLGGAAIAHGYGGSKEEQLGLAWRIAEAGLVACAIDLRGHGQNPMPLDENVMGDMEAAIRYLRKYGKVAAVGHSIGGRLALTSSADHAIGISPPLDHTYCARTQEQLRKFRSYRVRPDDPMVVFDILAKMPEWQANSDNRAMIIYGTRDVPEIAEACGALGPHQANVVRADDALHGDTYLLEAAFDAVTKQISRWFGDGKVRAADAPIEGSCGGAGTPNDAGA
ncbi:alpha/beta hydrolase [Methanomassiliicoccus luminyensis]|uniref:alpha/beta hydrolase n=1 Tax=Methanomassiliicoccus luminyensis TaxID=1080712 RepID=UPI00035CA2AE|nr:alpha/beta fold hydrolase [Methanomassiliicoccus luminyensis]